MALPDQVREYAKADQVVLDDLETYCANLVHIQDKTGEVRPFVWRAAQKILHQKLEQQREARGLVRAIVLKARRLGISTYVGARFYHRTSLSLGTNAFILTHEDKSTQELFELVKLIHANMEPAYKPETVAANANELAFATQNSGYRVGTAKNVQGLGRGLTLQLLHGSEASFWPHAEKHLAGILKTVSLVPGTEIILESTANGVGGAFYEQWGLAEKGLSDYIPTFLPWYIDPENRRPIDFEFEPSVEEEDYRDLYKLDDEQLAWAHFENIALGGEPGAFCPLFRQENPATAAEAFQTTGADSLIPAEAILRARRWTAGPQGFLPRVLGVDVARGGADRTRLVDRQGRKAGVIDEVMHTNDLTQVAYAVMRTLRDNDDIRKAFIDITGLGAGVYDICRVSGFESRVVGVNFGSKAQDETAYKNRRAEMWARMKQWFLDPGGADIPDDDEAHRHLAGPSYKWDLNSRLQLEDKAEMKKRLGFSPDWGDALGLTFAEILPVEMPDTKAKWERDHDAEVQDGHDWQTN